MKIGLLIPARLNSTRLPAKLLYSIEGKRIVDHVIERAKALPSIDEIVLCTSMDPQDAFLTKVAQESHAIPYFPGNTDDVLKRLYDAATFHQLDYIFSVAADHPFFSIEYANLMVNEAQKNKPDFIYVKGLPVGIGIHGVRYEALKTVTKFKSEKDTEMWVYWFDQPDVFDVTHMESRPEDQRDIRFTLDTSEDLSFLQQLGNNLPQNQWFSYQTLLQTAESLPLKYHTNRDVAQNELPASSKQSIEERYINKQKKFWSIKNKIYHPD